MQKLTLFLLSAIIIFLAGAVYVLAWNSGNSVIHGHNGDNIFIYVNGNSKSLQTAMNDGDFSDSFTGGGLYLGSIVRGHSGEEIIVNVAGTPKSLQTAINDGSLCNALAGTSPANFGTETYGNTGDEIQITTTSIKDLQTAINDGDFYGCMPTYLLADSTGILPAGTIRRSGNSEDAIQFILIFLTTPASEFDQTVHLTLSPGGAQSYDEAWFTDGTNAKVVGLFRRGDIMDTISQNGQIDATITGEMIEDYSYFYGEDTFWIGLFTGS